MNKSFACIAASAFLLSGCAQMETMMNDLTSAEQPKEEETAQQSSQPKFDAKATLKPYVMENVAMYVDASRIKVGESATKEMSANNEMTVAVVGEQNGHKVVELTASYIKDYVSGKPAAIAMEIDEKGKVLNAWGGLIGGESVALDIPKPIETTAATAAASDIKVETRDLESVTVCGVKAKGLESKTKHGTSKSWTTSDFPFFMGVIKTEVAGNVSVLKQYAKTGAKAQLKAVAN